MNKFLCALVCVIGLTVPALGQMTNVTAASLKIGTTPISTGTVCAVATDANDNPITVAIGGGGLQGAGQSCAVISSGAITTAVGGGTFAVADEAAAGNPGFYYRFTVTDTSIGNPTSKQGFILPKVPSVTGSSFALDRYFPVTSVTTIPVFTFTTGAGAPTLACSGKSFYQDNTVPSAPVLYSCGADSNFHIVTGTGSGSAGTISIASTTTGAAGTSASVTNSGTASAAVLHFTVPQGATGAAGATGATGTTGTAATITVGSVTTGAAGSQAAVTNAGTTSAAVFNFTIPQGIAGTGGAGTVPTGTGFVHVTSGTQDSSARLIAPSDIAPDTSHNGGLVANRAVGGSDVLPASPSVNGVVYTVKDGVGVLLYPDGSTKVVQVGPQTFSCQVAGPGDGLNTITAATYPLSGCFNEFGSTLTITAVKCFTDAGTSTLSVTNSAGTALLTGPISCGSIPIAGTLSGTPTLTSGDFAKFSFAAAGAVKQVTFIITGSR